MNSQEFYKSFKHRKKEDNRFFYGLERNEPISSLLFYWNNNVGTSSDQYTREFTENNFYFPNVTSNEIEISGGNPRYTKSLKDMVYSAAEIHFSRVSTYEFECSLCHHRCTYNDRMPHMLTCHSKFLSEIFDLNCSIIDDDEDFLNGLMLKLQFDSILTTPTKGYPPASQEACICAPPIFNKEDDFHIEDDEKTKKPIDSTQKISIRVQGALNPVLTKFANSHQPLTPVSEISQDIFFGDKNIDNPQILQTFEEFQNQNSVSPKPNIDTEIPTASDLSKNYDTRQQNTPTKSSGSPKSQTQSQQTQQSQINIATKHTETPKKSQSPSPSKASNSGNQTVKITAVEPTQTPPVQNSIPDGLFEQLKEDTRKPTPPKRPKSVPYLNLIPESLRDTIIANLAKEFIKSYVSSTTPNIVRPILQAKKKQHQKKMREEKAKKAKNEEMMRLAAMRQRKDNAIQKMSSDMVTPIIRSFIRSEIENIFIEESNAIKEASLNIAKIEQNEQAVLTPKPVVLFGLTNRRHLNAQFLREKFANLAFQLDENNEPKIRFRFNFNRWEVLLYLATMADVQHILSLSPFQIEYVTVTIMPEQEDQTSSFMSYAGQELKIIPATRHLENFADDKGIGGFISMCPVMCLEELNGIDEAEILK